MNLLFTGASGFLGKLIQHELDAAISILSIGRSIDNSIQCDLSKEIPTIFSIQAVLHAAGKAHVYPKTDAEKQVFFDVNVQGTKNLLQGLKDCELSHFIFISSVSVYGLDNGELITESNSLQGNSPYAKSKIEAENLVRSFCEKRKISYLILRLPLVVGKNPLGNLGTMMKAIQIGRYVRIAKGEAKKSMVLASDIGCLINSWLQQTNAISGTYNVTDGYHPTFFELEEALKVKYGKTKIPTIPTVLAKFLGKVGDTFSRFPVNSGIIRKITCSFTFSDEKARKEIAWNPRPVLNHIE